MSQPSQEANTGRSSIESEPGRWPAAKSTTLRASTTTPPDATTASTSAGVNGVSVGTVS